jgi:hypothetical protein
MKSSAIRTGRGAHEYASLFAVKSRDVEVARHNWISWRDVFEHKDTAADNPLLSDPDRFAAFAGEYSVGRTIRAGRRNSFRIALREEGPFIAALQDVSGGALDLEEMRLRGRFGTREGQRGIRSALSKVAAFVSPHSFVAYDKYAATGLAKVLGGKRAKSYAEYLEGMNTLLDGVVGQRIREICAGSYPTPYAHGHDRFNRRVLDTYLMRVGGRWDR